MSNVQLKEMASVAVIINTEKELNEYAQLCDQAGWRWHIGGGSVQAWRRPAGYNLPITMTVAKLVDWTDTIDYYPRNITLDQFKEEQGLGEDMSMFRGDRRVLISHPDQAKELVKRFGSTIETIGACDKTCWLNSKQATIYIENGKVTGWDHNAGQSHSHLWVDYQKLMEMTEPSVAPMPWDIVPPILTPSDHIADSLLYTQNFIPGACLEPSKEDTMTGTSFVTKHYINDCNVATMTVDQFLHAITAKKAQIGTLDSIDIKSDVLNAQIAAQEADLALIIAKMEEIHG